MGKTQIFLLIGIIMIIIAIIFLCFALSHPELSFPISLSVTRILYLLYGIITIIFFVLAIIFRKK